MKDAPAIPPRDKDTLYKLRETLSLGPTPQAFAQLGQKKRAEKQEANGGAPSGIRGYLVESADAVRVGAVHGGRVGPEHLPRRFQLGAGAAGQELGGRVETDRARAAAGAHPWRRERQRLVRGCRQPSRSG